MCNSKTSQEFSLDFCYKPISVDMGKNPPFPDLCPHLSSYILLPNLSLCQPLPGHACWYPHCSTHRRWPGMEWLGSASGSHPTDSCCPLKLPLQEEEWLASWKVPDTVPFLHGLFRKHRYLFLIVRKESSLLQQRCRERKENPAQG